MSIQNTLIHNKLEAQYELHIDNFIALAKYKLDGTKIYLTHVLVPKELEGKGVGSTLVLQTLQLIEKEGLKLIPECPFVATYIKRHPEWTDLLLDTSTIE